MTSQTVCVTGAAGYIGSSLTKSLLEKGYTVRATVRDPTNKRKVKHLEDLPDARTKLSLFKAFDDAIKGCTGVFHVASHTDPENEAIEPTIKFMQACQKAKTVRRVIFTLSAGTVNVSENQKVLFDETCWTNVEFCHRVKMTGWAEQEARKFAEKHNMDFITIIPPHVVGPFIMPTMPPSLPPALSPIYGNEADCSNIEQGQFVHLDDLCSAHIFLFEQPKVEGRYICSAWTATIGQIAKLINKKYPEYKMSTKFNNSPDESKPVRFSSRKLEDLGFQFKYTLENMYIGAIDTCREKGLLPKPEAPAKQA